MRASTSASQACGSTSFILAVTIRLYMTAARWPPRSEPQNNHDLRLWRPLHKRNYAHHVIMRSSPAESACGTYSSTTSRAQRTAHNSKALKELHQLVGGTIPPGARSDWLQPIEGALLH